MNTGSSDDRLNEVQLAKRWDLSPRTLQKWRVDNIGPDYLKLGSRVVYRLSDVIKFEKKSLFRGSGERAHPTSH